jgi:AhpD family alkylhydroperoxidase
MTQRVNPFTVVPDGVAALIGVEKYLQTCGLDHKLIALVKTRVSQVNRCAYCHMHTEEARKLGESEVRLYLLDAWHESNLYSARERAPLAWAERTLRPRMRPTPSMRRHGVIFRRRS